MLAISFKPEYLNTHGLPISNSLLASILVTIFLSCLSLIFLFSRKPNSLEKLLKVLIYEFLNTIDNVTQNRSVSKKLFPFVSTFFVFILFANLIGLLPGFLGAIFVKGLNVNKIPLLRSPNSDLNTTIALALVSVIGIQVYCINLIGLKNYIAKFIDFTSLSKAVVGFFAIISEIVKILSFSFRLFGNIFAGEVILILAAHFLPLLLPLPFMLLEIFVGVIQAYIFAILTLSFIKSSIGSSLQTA